MQIVFILFLNIPNDRHKYEGKRNQINEIKFQIKIKSHWKLFADLSTLLAAQSVESSFSLIRSDVST